MYTFYFIKYLKISFTYLYIIFYYINILYLRSKEN